MPAPLESTFLFSVPENLNKCLKRRDIPAFGYLYDKYSTPLYSLIISITADPFTANRILEKVFNITWKRINEFAGGRCSIFTWMYATAREEALLAKRQQELRNMIQENPSENIKNLFELKELVKELPEPYRSILLLAYFENTSDIEISGLLNIDTASVKENLKKGLVIINKMIARNDEIKKPSLISERVLAF